MGRTWPPKRCSFDHSPSPLFCPTIVCRAAQIWQPTHRFDTLQIPPHHTITLQPCFPDFSAKLGPSRTRHIARPGHTRLCRRRGGPVRHDAMPHRTPTAERAAAATGTAFRTGRVRMATRLAPPAPSARPGEFFCPPTAFHDSRASRPRTGAAGHHSREDRPTDTYKARQYKP